MSSCSSSSGTKRARSTALNSLKNGVAASDSAALRPGGAASVVGDASGGGRVRWLIAASDAPPVPTTHRLLSNFLQERSRSCPLPRRWAERFRIVRRQGRIGQTEELK